MLKDIYYTCPPSEIDALKLTEQDKTNKQGSIPLPLWRAGRDTCRAGAHRPLGLNERPIGAFFFFIECRWNHMETNPRYYGGSFPARFRQKVIQKSIEVS